MAVINVTNRAGKTQTIPGKVGNTLMENLRDAGMDVEAICGGCCSCATCHVIVDAEWFEKLGDPTEDEEDMLDLAFGLEKTSRLGCQIVMSEALDGLVVRIPPTQTAT